MLIEHRQELDPNMVIPGLTKPQLHDKNTRVLAVAFSYWAVVYSSLIRFTVAGMTFEVVITAVGAHAGLGKCCLYYEVLVLQYKIYGPSVYN